MYGKVNGKYIASPEVGAGKGYSLWRWEISSSFVFVRNRGWVRDEIEFFWGKVIEEVCKLEIIVMCGELCNEPI